MGVKIVGFLWELVYIKPDMYDLLTGNLCPLKKSRRYIYQNGITNHLKSPFLPTGLADTSSFVTTMGDEFMRAGG